MTEKVTVMVLKVDLQCPCCYKKVRKILRKFPQIRDEEYDEKGNKVTITVVCCNPEKIRDKLCCNGAKVIKCIEIKESAKHKESEKPKDPEKPKEPKKSMEVVAPPEKPKNAPKPELTPNPLKTPDLVPVFLTQPTCCGPCSQGYGGGPCHYGYGVPPPPQPCYDGPYGNGCHENGRGTHYYFTEESPQSCSIM